MQLRQAHRMHVLGLLVLQLQQLLVHRLRVEWLSCVRLSSGTRGCSKLRRVATCCTSSCPGGRLCGGDIQGCQQASCSSCLSLQHRMRGACKRKGEGRKTLVEEVEWATPGQLLVAQLAAAWPELIALPTCLIWCTTAASRRRTLLCPSRAGAARCR